MRKRQGFISIIALIIMSVLLVMVLYLGYTSHLEYLILSSSTAEAQGYYQSEGKIYLSLYDEKYYEDQLYLSIIDYFRNDGSTKRPKVVAIDDFDLENDDREKNVELRYTTKDNRKMLNMIAESNNRGILAELTCSGTLVNEIFEKDYPILSNEAVDEKDKDELGKILMEINEKISVKDCYKPTSLFGVDLDQYSEILLKNKDKNNLELNYRRDTMINPHVGGFSGREAIIVARKPKDGQLNFYIGDPDKTSEKIVLSGVLYVNGNLIISDEFTFNGILIVEDGEIIINTGKKPEIFGLVILNKVENYDDFIEKTDIILVKRLLYRYGTYVPGFLDPKMSVIKSNRIKELGK